MSDPMLEWIESIASGSQGGNCVEVAFADGEVFLRDSKDPDGPMLRFRGTEWDAFLTGAKNGEFDRGNRQLGQE